MYNEPQLYDMYNALPEQTRAVLTRREYVWLAAGCDNAAGSTDGDTLDSRVARRLSGEPLQYIIGDWDFYGHTFYVGRGVLIPRPETEMIVEAALSRIGGAGGSAGGRRYGYVEDWCAGSGCVGISVALAVSGVTVTCVERDSAAFAVLSRNNARYNNAAVCRRGDIFRRVRDVRDGTLILVNPPYLNKDEMRELQPEVAYEPAVALYGGKDGLYFYRRIAELLPLLLSRGCGVIAEVGDTQGETVAALWRERGAVVRIMYDYSGHGRVVTVES
ncbi:protein-(glutamine-N5) methyltransferase, release factor-specific [Clostridia bacterium]|nr:protein-(glutamine-N5) methyltransferase, release factor-specific [Clostridia bacterium]